MNKTYIYLMLLPLAWACSKEQKTDEADKPILLSVKTDSVSTRSFHENINSSGVLSSKSQIKLSFKTGGLIKKSYVEEGQYVKTGQLLAELDLSEIEAQVNQAKIGYEKSKRDFERVENLYKDEAATQTMLNDAKSGLDLATQSLSAAQFNQKLSKIYAPSSGRILMKLAEPGELIAPFNPMFILGSGDQAYVVKVGLTDRDIVKVSLEDKAEVKLDAYPDEIFYGKVTQKAQMINQATGTYEVEVEVSPNGKSLISGFVAEINISTKQVAQTLTIPISALVNAQGKSAEVYVYTGGKVHKKAVTLGKIYGDYVAVSSGVNAGETVVTLGSGYVSDGEQVNISQ